jgi:hypothetical protein
MILLDFPLWIGWSADVLTPAGDCAVSPGQKQRTGPVSAFRGRSQRSIRSIAICDWTELHPLAEEQGVPQHAIASHARIRRNAPKLARFAKSLTGAEFRAC